MIRALLFDLGNVLLYFSHERACEQMGRLCGVEAGRIREIVFESGLEWQYERGSLTTEQFHRRFEEAVGRAVPADELTRAGCEIFWPNLTMEPVVRGLAESEHRLVLLSNTNVAHFEFVEREYPILESFPSRVLSYEVGACKPDPKIFAAATEAAGCESCECFYIDDVPEYVEAACALGFDAVVYTDTPSLIQELARRQVEM